MLNRVTLIGRMTRDPELRRTGNGKAVASFNLAVGRNYTQREGEPTADFINVVCWSKVAESTAQHCGKGSLVGVDGRLQTRNYENNQGQRVFVTEVIADTIQFLDPKGNNNRQATPKQEATQPTVDNSAIREFEESDIQF
jgi:single-strand DNA-binding protein